jgi:hypothetical protein
MMQEQAPHVYAWVQRMNDPPVSSGNFLDDDAIPDSLLPILETLCTDQLPDVLDVIAHNSAWLDANPGGSIPRFLGMHPFSSGSARGERCISSYAQWLFQRAWWHYQSLSGDDKASADRLLARIGGLAAMNTTLPYWLERRPGQLELVEGELPPYRPH